MPVSFGICGNRAHTFGSACETNFKNITDLQTAMRMTFSEVKADLDAGNVEIQKALKNAEIGPALLEICGKELELYETMVDAFVKLESNIVYVLVDSMASKTDYGKFKNASKQLNLASGATALNCGAMNIAEDQPAPGALATNFAKGSADFVRGKSENPVSDITGTVEDERKRALMRGKAPAY